ncbi:MAG: helix-turn-helix domain-containing protein [Coprothermobacterota bacterium]|nr:helix-turn-helix domain-containing protein [Coprothermobacterota bacterium]
MAEMDIGTALKELRLSRGIILEEVEQVTRISLRYLQAIEENNFLVMPGLVYARAYVRKYGEFLGLDPEPLVEAFNRQAIPLYQIEKSPERIPTPSVEAFTRRSNPWTRALVIIAIILVLVVGGLIIANILLPSTAPPPTNTPTVTPTSTASLSITPPATTSPTANLPTGSPLPTGNEVEVRVTALESGHILVQSADRVIFEQTMEAGTTYTFRQWTFTITFDDPVKFELSVDGNPVAAPLPSIFQYPAP